MIHLIVGLVALVVGAWGVIAWWDDFGAVLRGLVPAWLVLVGLAAIATGLQQAALKPKDAGEDWGEPAPNEPLHAAED